MNQIPADMICLPLLSCAVRCSEQITLTSISLHVFSLEIFTLAAPVILLACPTVLDNRAKRRLANSSSDSVWVLLASHAQRRHAREDPEALSHSMGLDSQLAESFGLE